MRKRFASETQPRFPTSDGADLPEGWTESTLDHLLCALESGSRPKGGARGIVDGVPSVGAEHLNPDGGFRFEKVKFVPKEFFRSMKRGVIKCGDVLVVKDGATTGKVSLVRADFPYSEAAVNEHVFVCRSAEGVEPAFLFLYLFSKEGRERILENFQGSAQGGINQGFAQGTTVPLAPLAEQKRIVAKVEELLARVNAAREHLAKVPAILKRFRQSVLAAACSGRLTEEWRESHPEAVVSTPEYSQPDTCDLPAIPETWQWCCFNSLLTDFRNGISTKPNIDPPGKAMLRISAVRAMSVNLEDYRYLVSDDPKLDMYRLADGDLLFTRYNGSIDLLGVCGMVRGLGDRYVLYPDKLMRARVRKKVVLPEYCRLFFSESLARQRMVGESKSSAGQQGIAGSDVKNQSVALPPLSEQHEIIRRVDSLFALADSIEKQAAAGTARVEKLTQAILAKAFRGELVPQDPDDEPAAILLRRAKGAR